MSPIVPRVLLSKKTWLNFLPVKTFSIVYSIQSLSVDNKTFNISLDQSGLDSWDKHYVYFFYEDESFGYVKTYSKSNQWWNLEKTISLSSHLVRT